MGSQTFCWNPMLRKHLLIYFIKIFGDSNLNAFSIIYTNSLQKNLNTVWI